MLKKRFERCIQILSKFLNGVLMLFICKTTPSTLSECSKNWNTTLVDSSASNVSCKFLRKKTRHVVES